MSRSRAKPVRSLADRFPPSEPCGCPVCLNYCSRPGWWTVEEADRAVRAGYGSRIMVELSPDHSFFVLSPAFQGNESAFALKHFAGRGCTFLHDNRCELHGTGYMPLECRFCHHERTGQGQQCHAALEEDWNTPTGQSLVIRWAKQVGYWDKLKLYKMDWLKRR